AAGDNPRDPLVRDISKARFGEQPGQQTPEIPIYDPAVMKRLESLLSRRIEPGGELMRAVNGNHASAINFLHQKPAATTQRSRHTTQRSRGFVKMHQQPTAMNEVIRVNFRLILCDVNSPNLDVSLTEILEEARIYVRRDNRTILADAITQPTNNRTRTGPDL